MIKDFVKIIGENPGTVSIILGGVHGDEICGIKAIETLIASLKIERGTVYLGYGNPAAITASKRQTEANLNRMFCEERLSPANRASYEYGRAQFLKSYLDKASALLDIHASFTPDSKPFVICENNSKGIVEYLPVDLMVSGFDTIEPGGTDYYMNKTGRIGICVECGNIKDSASDQLAVDAAFAFLKARGHITNDLSKRLQQRIRMYMLYKNKSTFFKLTKPFRDFEVVKAGKLIGQDGVEEIRAHEDGVILFAQNSLAPGQEVFLFGK